MCLVPTRIYPTCCTHDSSHGRRLMDCCCGHSASQLVPTAANPYHSWHTAPPQPLPPPPILPTWNCWRPAGCLVTHLQLQLLNQLLRAERPWQVILVPQHQQRNAIQAGLGKQRMQLLGSNLQDTKGYRVTTRSSTWRYAGLGACGAAVAISRWCMAGDWRSAAAIIVH